MQRPRRQRARQRRPRGPMERILISPEFALLWLKQSVTALCDALFGTTLVIWLATRTNSPLEVGLGLIALGAPYALFGPFAEAATERWSRRRTMFVTDVVRGVLTFFLCIMVLPILTPTRALAIIYLLCFVIGLMSRFSLAAQRSAITAVVRPKEHARGISRIQGSVAIMGIAGPVLAAVLFLILGPSPLPGLVVAGFLLLLSAGGAQAMDQEFTAKVRAIQTRRKRRDDTQDGEEGQDAAQEEEVEEEPWNPSVLRAGIADGLKGMRLVLQQRPFRTVARTVALVAFVGGIFNVLEVFFIGTYLGEPAAYLGLLVSANAAGVLLGSAWFRQLDAHLTPITTFTFAVLGMGLTTAAFISTRDIDFAILWAAAMGVTNGMLLFAAQTTLVETGERAYIARLFVGYETQTALMGTIGILVGSVAAATISIGTVLGVASGLLIFGAVGAWLILSGRAAHFRYHKAAAQNTDEHESAYAPDETSEEYEPEADEAVDDQMAGFDEGEEQQEEEEQPMYRPPSRQFNRPWAGHAARQNGASYDEDDADQYTEDDEGQWEPAAPVEEPPEPRRSLRLRPAPWEQSGGPGRRR